jgi:predicted Zn-dependent protease
VFYFYILPWFAGSVAEKIPANLEKDFGDAIFKNTISRYEINDSITGKVNAFAREINFKTDYPIEVTVVKQDEVNAFALPGGHVIVFDKIIREMKTKEELAALLAHEVAHIHYRHSLKSIFRSLSGYLLISLVFSDISGITAILADNSNMLLNLSFSRNLEAQADEKATEILIANGLDLNGCVNLFALLKKQSKDAMTFQLLSTHPLTDERILFAKKAARNQKGIKANQKLENIWSTIQN